MAFLSQILKYLLAVAVLIGILAVGAAFKEYVLFSGSSFSVNGSEISVVIAILACIVAKTWNVDRGSSPVSKNGD